MADLRKSWRILASERHILEIDGVQQEVLIERQKTMGASQKFLDGGFEQRIFNMDF